ncbi:anthranilate synthase component I family protein [Compostimonas suwonensis]|uniref:Anthranilate synthase component 1 n=1 Tax=Compostimonas suwonensis TaxID=1048394 RepID=A0A2M9BZ65_9MICO|nr:anthranilate synthase component I family protein [Compostimonas suwonensis]PJJ63377.1 anthranilate synthase component 1 [Compostimonas suwonensis]
MIRRLLRLPVDAWVDPAIVFAGLYAAEPYAVWLDAGADASSNGASSRSYLAAGRAQSELITADVATATVTRRRLDGAHESTRPGAILDVLAEALAGASVSSDAVSSASVSSDAVQDARSDGDGASRGGFRLGWVGWLGYEAGASAAGAPVAASRYPDAALLFVDRAVEFDHGSQAITLLAFDDDGAEHWLRQTAAAIAQLRESDGTAPDRRAETSDIVASTSAPGHDDASPRWRHGEERYLELVRECQEAIRRGDAYQLCLTNEVRVHGRFDPLAVYRGLRELSPTRNGGLLRFGELSVLSATPEQFLRVSSDGHVSTSPIKGTRPRGADSEDDSGLRAELLASDKERAENLMIVDLMRNDLSRVARLGTVEVTRLLEVESYAQVHQLVSTVEAQLDEGSSGVDVVRACFPAGSMTGAPKSSAMGILHALEAGPRGVYSGVFGYFGIDGAIDLAMVIRSIVLGPDAAAIGTGGGITALSVPEEELAETRVKVDALLGLLAR